MALNGFIKIYRSFLEWEWYKKLDTKVLFLHLLLNAQFKQRKWQGILIEPGQLITGRTELANQTGLTEQRVRSALNHLQSTGEITIKATNKYSLITVVNWAKYQNEEEIQPAEQPATNQQLTSNQPATNQRSTSNQPQRKNDNKEKKEKNESITDLFDLFWSAYPKHQNKSEALKAFSKLKPSPDQLEHMLSSIAIWKNSDQWTKDGGQYVPLPSTWLKGRRWEDEPPASRQSYELSNAQRELERTYEEKELEERLGVNDIFRKQNSGEDPRAALGESL